MSYPGPAPDTPLIQWCRKIRDMAVDVLFPRACFVCKEPLPHQTPRQGVNAWFCQPCLDQFPKVTDPKCSVCGEPYEGKIETAFRCGNCDGLRLAFDFSVSAYRADGAVLDLLHRFKYGREIALRGALSDLLLESLNDTRLEAENLTDWLLVPVPLYFWREWKRQFNQSWQLCQQLSARTGIPAVRVLRRRRPTAAQARLNRQQRRTNLRQAFTLLRSLLWRKIPNVEGRKILLVDDVLTTGSTAHACAKMLKRKGRAEKVVVITVARG